MARHRRVEAVGRSQWISWTGRGPGVGANRVVLLCRQQRIWSTPSRGSRFTAQEIRDGLASRRRERASEWLQIWVVDLGRSSRTLDAFVAGPYFGPPI